MNAFFSLLMRLLALVIFQDYGENTALITPSTFSEAFSFPAKDSDTFCSCLIKFMDMFETIKNKVSL